MLETLSEGEKYEINLSKSERVTLFRKNKNKQYYVCEIKINSADANGRANAVRVLEGIARSTGLLTQSE